MKKWIVGLFLLVAQVGVLRWQGRVWWCACEKSHLWVSDTFSSHNSQHLLDPYSFSHFLHGVIFFWLLWLIVPRLGFAWRFVISIGIEILWEIAENSSWVIERYRSATAALGYTGDSIINSLADIGCCALGVFVARWIGWRGSLVVFLLVEILLALWVRDNLTLNVIMLIHPVEAIKHWQLAP